jgi:predicted transcriptional regulator
MTRHEIADATGISLQSVCGRVAELMSSGEIREQVVAGRKIVRDGRHVLIATITQTQRAG